MKKYDLLENVAFARYTIRETLPVGTQVEVAWPDGTSVRCTVIEERADGSLCTPT